MYFGHLVKAVRRAKPWVISLACLAVILIGCQAQKPPLSKEAQALKKKLLGEIDKLTTQLVGPVSKQDWEAVKLILQTTYENMQKEATLVPEMIVVLDRNSISRVRVPSTEERHFDFSNYTQAKTVFNEKKKVQATLYFKGMKIYVFLAPLLHNSKVLGAVSITFSENELEKKWGISEKEFLSIDFNQ